MWIVALIFGAIPAMIFFDWTDYEDPISLALTLTYWTFLMMSVFYLFWATLIGYRRHHKAGRDNPLRYRINYAIIIGSVMGAGIGPIFGSAGTMMAILPTIAFNL